VNPRMRFLEKDLLAAIAPGQGNVIGTGAKSIVYKAVSPNDDAIAIKVLRDVQHPWKSNQRDKDQWEKEIMNEVRTLGQLRHRNIIKIFTLCFSLDIKAIILEYMPNGSLHGHLHDNSNCDLTWEQRFRILLGVTHGLVYLHHEFSDPIIHRDLKASNILLDEDLEPKLCDFGISKFVTNEHGEATATAFCGTFGYIAPEYGTGARLSTKGDVYSYGVVLLELLSGKEATEANRMIPSGGIVEDRFLLADMPAFELLDPTLKSEAAKNPEVREQMLSTMRVGHLCTNSQPENRPTMNDVLLMLLEIQQI
jgi:serine/threonine protein kinase